MKGRRGSTVTPQKRAASELFEAGRLLIRSGAAPSSASGDTKAIKRTEACGGSEHRGRAKQNAGGERATKGRRGSKITPQERAAIEQRNRELFETGRLLVQSGATPNTPLSTGKQSLIRIDRGAEFEAADADVRAQRTRWHELLDSILDGADSDVLRALSIRLEVYSEVSSDNRSETQAAGPLPIPAGARFVMTDAEVRTQRARWHELLDVIMDSGGSDVLSATAAHLKAYAKIVAHESMRGGTPSR
jgi:hypothetical protein